MPDDLSSLGRAPFAAAVNDFEQLISQSDRCFLIGAGCSKCAGLPLTPELTDLVLGETNGRTREVLHALIAEFTGADGVTIEEYMSEVVDRIAIASRRADRGAANLDTPMGSQTFSVDELFSALDEMKNAIAHCIETRAPKIATHWQFVKSVHRTLRTGKGQMSRPVDYFVLNYDTLIEDALGLERIPWWG
jgi:hypothetical protein